MRIRVYIAELTWFVLVFAFVLLDLETGLPFWVAAVLVHVLVAAFLMTRRCENCRARVLRQRARVAGLEFTYWTPFVAERCDKCSQRI